MSHSYEKEVERLQRLFDEVPSDEERDENEDSDTDIDEVIESDHNSATEQELTDDENNDDPQNNVPIQAGSRRHLFFTTRHGMTWNKICSTRSVRTRQHNLLKILPGVIGNAKNAKTPLECLELFFDETILQKIVECTNIYIQSISHRYQDKSDTRPTSLDEMKAVIGLFFLAGVLRSNHLSIFELWAQDGTGIELFSATMALRRFRFILRCLRFDDVTTRAERRTVDKLAAIREVFESVNSNFKKHYCVGEYTTIDEMLLAFRGRCSFRMYIPNKPSRYGIKVFSLVDAKTYYTLNLEVYTGKQPDGPFFVSTAAKDVVERLCEPISQSKRNVTLDNWFTSTELATSLLKNHKLTLLGTIRKNKPQIPSEFLKIVRPPHSSMFGFTEEMTLVSYIPKKNKNVLLLSTMHHDDAIDDSTGEAHKPEMITDYNRTKGGVDSVDQLCSSYNVARSTRRWPMTVFYGLLNVAALNAYIVYRSNSVDPVNKYTGRRKFLKDLSRQLIEPYMIQRVSCPHLSRETRRQAARLSGVPFQEAVQNVANRRGRCVHCKDRKTKYSCELCKKYLCLEHSKQVCEDCVQKFNQ